MPNPPNPQTFRLIPFVIGIRKALHVHIKGQEDTAPVTDATHGGPLGAEPGDSGDARRNVQVDEYR